MANESAWPVTALWSGLLALGVYLRWGHAGRRDIVTQAGERGAPPLNQQQPFPVVVANSATHRGSGCMLGDIVPEPLAAAVPFALFDYR